MSDAPKRNPPLDPAPDPAPDLSELRAAFQTAMAAHTPMTAAMSNALAEAAEQLQASGWAEPYSSMSETMSNALASADISGPAEHFTATHAALEAFARVDVSGLAEQLQADRAAVARALPSCEDFWMDLLTFSTMSLPWGLGLSNNQFWGLSYREWFARYRVWKFHNRQVE